MLLRLTPCQRLLFSPISLKWPLDAAARMRGPRLLYAIVVSISVAMPSLAAENLSPMLAKYVAARTAQFDVIAADRQAKLDELATYIRKQRDAGEPVRLVFICTHNSRRSHMAQLWAAAAAASYGIDDVETFSGGTEATAFNPRAVAALERAGFEIKTSAPADANPKYLVRLSSGADPIECFSKVYDQAPNPKSDFCAVMTCSSADKACPLVSGATLRLAIPYDDPKVADGTPDETATYDERCAQIAREMLFAFSHAASK
jgi:arsenate reductase